MNRSRKAIGALLSGIFFVAILMTGITLTYTITKPQMDSIKDIAQVEQATRSMRSIESAIRAVSYEGTFSTRKISVAVPDGMIYVDNSTNKLYYNIKTESTVVSPRSTTTSGNLIISSNSDVSVTEQAADYIIENDHLKINLTRTTTNPENISTSDLVNSIYFKDESKTIEDGFVLKIDNQVINGVGYSYPLSTGTELSKGVIIYHMDFNLTSVQYSMDIYFTLETGADFLTTEIKNFQRI